MISQKIWHPGLKIIFVIKPFLARAKRSLTVPSFKALAVSFPNFQNSGYVKQHNVALPLQANCHLELCSLTENSFLAKSDNPARATQQQKKHRTKPN